MCSLSQTWKGNAIILRDGNLRDEQEGVAVATPSCPGHKMVQIRRGQGHYGPVTDPHLRFNLREGQVVVRLARDHQDHCEPTIVGVTMSLISGSPIDHSELVGPWLSWPREGLSVWLLAKC